MADLVYKISSEETLKNILLAVVPYMKGLVYRRIIVLSAGKQRIILERKGDGYQLFGCVLTPALIRKRYS